MPFRVPRRRTPAVPAQGPLRVDVRPVNALLEKDLARIDHLSRLLDTQFNVAGVRFGWDSLIGLVPGVGDVATAALALYPVYLAHRHGLGRWTQLKMLSNVGVDALVGVVPVAGDVFDLAFKANRRNLDLFRQAVEKGRRRGKL